MNPPARASKPVGTARIMASGVPKKGEARKIATSETRSVPRRTVCRRGVGAIDTQIAGRYTRDMARSARPGQIPSSGGSMNTARAIRDRGRKPVSPPISPSHEGLAGRAGGASRAGEAGGCAGVGPRSRRSRR